MNIVSNCLSKTSKLLFILICLFCFAVRFVNLEVSPPGIFVDEASCTAHVTCLKEFGKNCNKQILPIYSVTWGHGRVGPVFQYSALAWTSVFGADITSFRLFLATTGLLTVYLLYLIALQLGNQHIAYGVGFSALLSPWLFHSARVIWDPALGPLMATLTIYLFLKASKGKKVLYLTLSSIACVLTFHTYSPVGAQMFFIFMFLFFFQKFIVHYRFINWFGYGLLTLLLFLSIYWIDVTAVMGRAESLSIFGNHPNNPTTGQGLDARLMQFVTNVLAHLNPRFLILKSDPIMRHTVYEYGVISWADTLGAGLALLIAFFSLFIKRLRLDKETSKQYLALLLLGFFGYLSASMSASLTWDSIPHGLRSLGGVPFLIIFFGTCLAYVARFIWLRFALLICAGYFVFNFYSYYFTQFRIDSAWWFDSDVYIALNKSLINEDRAYWDKFMKERGYPAQARRYFDIQYFKVGEEVLQ